MGNPFNQINPMHNMYQMLTQSSNPMQLFAQLAQQNPQLQPVLNILKNGANPQQLFISMCQQRGINPQEFLKNITGK